MPIKFILKGMKLGFDIYEHRKCNDSNKLIPSYK